MKAVATTFTKQGYELHGRKFVETFKKHWPDDVVLRAYPEGFSLEGRELHLNCPELVKFKLACRDPAAHGVLEGGYKRDFDAVKWCHRIFALKAAADEGCEVLMNMDSDIVTFSPVTHKFLDDLLQDCDIAYMPRKIYRYSECSFVIYRMTPKVKDFIDAHQKLYTTGDIFELPGWTDCHGFDYLLTKFDIKSRDINEGLPASMHPFVNGPLGTCMDHMKGPRKLEGRSRKTDLVVDRTEAYWR
jgi:hypothetical protein